MSITSNKDTDILILILLDEESFSNMSRVNKYMYELCKNENLWRCKFAKRYNRIIIKDSDYLYKNYSWQKLYRKLNYDHIYIMQRAYEFRKTNLVITIFENYNIDDEEIIDMIYQAFFISSPFFISYIEFVYSFFECKRVKSLNLTELFRVSCDSRGQIEGIEHLELLFLLQEAGLKFEIYDVIFAIRSRNAEIVKMVLFDEGVKYALMEEQKKNEIVGIVANIYGEAVEICRNYGEVHILKFLHGSYLTCPYEYIEYVEQVVL
jgi:hypothetical protein